MLDLMTGPLAIFDGAMTNACTRKATCIEIIETAVFESLEFEFPAEQAEQANPNTVAFPPLMYLLNVKSFKLDSGSILVAFRV